MLLSARVKSWLIQNAGVAANASDEIFMKAAGTALAKGTLTNEKWTELMTTKAVDDANVFNSTMSELASTLGELKGLLTAEPADTVTTTKTGKVPTTKAVETEVVEEVETPAKAAVVPDTKAHKPGWLEKMVTSMGGTPDEDDEKSFDIRVKSAAEMYDGSTKAMHYPTTTKSGAAHPMAGRPVMDYNEPGKGRAVEDASERGKAVAGAFSKFLIKAATLKSRNLAFHSLPEHDRDLLVHAMQHEKWGGSSDGGNEADIKDRKLTPREQKALIDDSTSGGLEAAPIVFDDMIITTPLLYGELYPLVNTIPLDRGRRIEGVATGTVSGGWGGVDDTSISLFDTTAYVTAFDTTIFRWEGAVRIGLDFLSDTAIDFGAHITAQYGERLLEDLDDVIATGNGSTQPEGISVKSGTTSVSWSSTTSLGNYESLMFAVAKPEKRPNLMGSAVFCGTDTSYQRARAIPVGASDARRLGGTLPSIGGTNEYGSYSWMGTPFKVNESLGNTKVFYAILARYRMYRRRGLTLRTSTEGDTLIRKNEMLIVAQARYGGQLERGGCAAVTSTAPA